VKRKHPRPAIPVWFGMVWTGAGVVFLAVAVATAWSHVAAEREYRAGGLTVEGMVLTKSKTSSRRGGVRYGVRYRYRAGSADREGSASVGREQWERLHERGPIAIQFLPGTAASRIEGARGSVALPVVFSILGAALTLMGRLFARLAGRARAGGRA
jgi:hypothetical protein